MSTFNWLHLTDLHWGLNAQSSLWPNVREAFFNDLDKIHDRCGPWQAVFFTGDLVQQGKLEEFKQLEENVLLPLWNHLNKLGSGDAVLLAVPGNHDLFRPDTKKKSLALKCLLKPDLFNEIADDLFDGGVSECRQILNEVFGGYLNWWDSTRKKSRIPISEGMLPGDMSASFELDSKFRVGVIGLNTSFLQLECGDYKGKLAWDIRQFHNSCGGDGPGWVAEHDVCLLLTHHGPEWLNTNSLQNVYSEINPAGRFAAHLFGHMHIGASETKRSCGGGDLRRWQGFSLFGMEPHGDPPQYERKHGYSGGQIEFFDGKATIRQWPRIAVKDTNGWRLKPNDGEFGFVLLEDQGTEPEPIKMQPRHLKCSSPTSNIGKSKKSLSFTERQTLETYIKAARQLWDIIDLAGLPEDDRHLALKKFLLRQLYAPLRLTVEKTATQDWTELAAKTLEKERDRKRLADAGHVEKMDFEHSTLLEEKFSIGERLSLKSPRFKHIISSSTGPVARLVILGDPGGGKTTLLRWLATAYLLRYAGDDDYLLLPDTDSLPDKTWLPILVRCRELDKNRVEHYTLEDILRQTLVKLELSYGQVQSLVELLRSMLELGEVLLLIDGLDEITDPTLRSSFCRRIETISQRFPNAPMVITSRIVGYRELKHRLTGGFEHTKLADLSSKEKDRFIRCWCEITIPDSLRRTIEADKLIRGVHGSTRIEQLTGNPMLLTTLALVQRKVGKLPSKRHKLYWEAVSVLLNWRSDVDDPLDADEALPQLEYVAWSMCDAGIQRLRKDSLIILLENVRREYPNIRPLQQQTPEKFLAQLEQRTGLLVEMGYEQHEGHQVPMYEFRHLTFQEYLGALAIVKGRYPGHKRESTLADRVEPLARKLDSTGERVVENWREALRLCIATCNDDDVDSALLAILGDNKVTPDTARESRPRAILASLCLTDEPNVRESTMEVVLESLVNKVGNDDGCKHLAYSDLDNAVLELANSPWCKQLQIALARELLKRKPSTSTCISDLLNMICVMQLSSGNYHVEQWNLDQVSNLMSDDDAIALLSALALKYSLHMSYFKIIPGLINGTISLLSRGEMAAYTACHLLTMFINSFAMKNGAWMPTSTEIAEIQSHLADAGYVQQALIWLSPVIKNIQTDNEVPFLLTLLKNPSIDVRKAALEALTCIRGDDTDAKLLGIYNNSIGSISSTCLDPQAIIDMKRVGHVSNLLKIELDEIIRRYEILVKDFGLKVSWQPARGKTNKRKVL